MRKITEKTVCVFNNNQNITINNTEVRHDTKKQKTEMMLYGSVIAKKTKSGVYISHCGYTTNTTKERLNGVISKICGCANGIFQKKGEWFLTLHGETISMSRDTFYKIK